MGAKDELGRRGEQLAADYLTVKGFRLVERNWRCSHGEIDLIAIDGRETVFIEVKTRSSLAYGPPLGAITPSKLARLRRLAGAWCHEHPGAGHGIRIDAIGIVAPRGGDVRLEHLQGIA